MSINNYIAAAGVLSALYSSCGTADGATFNRDGDDKLAPITLNTVEPPLISDRGGVPVVLRGAALPKDPVVYFNGVRAADPRLLDANRISVTVPTLSGSYGSIRVQLLSGDGKRSVSRPDVLTGYAEELDFGLQPPLFGGTAPLLLTVADLNADGKPDLAASNLKGSALPLLLGDGRGGFAAMDFRSAPAVSGFSNALVAADLNQDDHVDLIASSYGDSRIAVFLNRGDATFESALYVDLGAEAAALTSADFNRDGKPDLASADYASNQVSILLGNGRGGFAAPVRYPVGGMPAALAALDVDGDRILDLLVAREGDGKVQALVGNGSGGFAAQPAFPVCAGPRSLATGDVNQDGTVDVAVSCTAALQVVLLANHGASGLSLASTQVVRGRPLGIDLADLNGDGKLDLVAAYIDALSVETLLGDGTFRFVSGRQFDSGLNPAAVLARDLDGDRRPDLAVANLRGGSLSVFLNKSR